MKIKLRLEYWYYNALASITNRIASVASRIMRSVGAASNRYEASAYIAHIEIIKKR